MAKSATHVVIKTVDEPCQEETQGHTSGVRTGCTKKGAQNLGMGGFRFLAQSEVLPLGWDNEDQLPPKTREPHRERRRPVDILSTSSQPSSIKTPEGEQEKNADPCDTLRMEEARVRERCSERHHDTY